MGARLLGVAARDEAPAEAGAVWWAVVGSRPSGMAVRAWQQGKAVEVASVWGADEAGARAPDGSWLQGGRRSAQAVTTTVTQRFRSMFSIARFLTVNGAVDGGRTDSRRFSLARANRGPEYQLMHSPQANAEYYRMGRSASVREVNNTSPRAGR